MLLDLALVLHVSLLLHQAITLASDLTTSNYKEKKVWRPVVGFDSSRHTHATTHTDEEDNDCLKEDPSPITMIHKWRFEILLQHEKVRTKAQVCSVKNYYGRILRIYSHLLAVSSLRLSHVCFSILFGTYRNGIKKPVSSKDLMKMYTF